MALGRLLRLLAAPPGDRGWRHRPVRWYIVWHWDILGKRFPFWPQDLLCHVSFVSILTISILIHNFHNLIWGFLKLSLKRFLYFKSLPFCLLLHQTHTYRPFLSHQWCHCPKGYDRVLVNIHLTHFIFRSSFLSLRSPFSQPLQPVISLLYTCLMLPFWLHRATHMNLVIHKWTPYCL